MDAKISIRRLVWPRRSQNFKRQTTIYSDGTINQPPVIVKMAWLFPMPDSGAIIHWWHPWPIQENPFSLSTVPEKSRPIAVHRCESIIAKIFYPISWIKYRYGEINTLGKQAIRTFLINIVPLFSIWDARKNQVYIADGIGVSRWKLFERKNKYEMKTHQRKLPENLKDKVVKKRNQETSNRIPICLRIFMLTRQMRKSLWDLCLKKSVAAIEIC